MATISRKPFQIGEASLRFAALSFRQLDALKEDIDLLMSPTGANFADSAARAAILRVALASLSSAEPQVTADFLMDGLNTFNFAGVIDAIFNRNGFLADPADAGAGEAVAAASPS